MKMKVFEKTITYIYRTMQGDDEEARNTAEEVFKNNPNDPHLEKVEGPFNLDRVVELDPATKELPSSYWEEVQADVNVSSANKALFKSLERLSNTTLDERIQERKKRQEGLTSSTPEATTPEVESEPEKHDITLKEFVSFCKSQEKCSNCPVVEDCRFNCPKIWNAEDMETLILHERARIKREASEKEYSTDDIVIKHVDNIEEKYGIPNPNKTVFPGDDGIFISVDDLVKGNPKISIDDKVSSFRVSTTGDMMLRGQV